MSSILTGAGGGRTYGFDLDFVRSPSPLIRPSHTSSSSTSPSSTLTESSNSPLAISTRKSRAPRKRPNQTYNEAAALLSTAYPDLFSNKNLKKPGQFSRPNDAALLDESAEELFLPFRVLEDDSASSFLLQQQIQHKPSSLMEPKVVNLQEKSCQSPGEIISRVNSLELNDDCEEDFDAESILGEEIDEGIDSIIGSRAEDDSNNVSSHGEGGNNWTVDSSGFGFGAKYDLHLGLVKAFRRVDDSNWWNFPAVDIVEISPRIKKHTSSSAAPAEKGKEKEKKKKLWTTTTTKKVAEKAKVKSLRGISIPKSNASKLMLKLNYDNVLSAWSDRGSPFANSPGNDANVGSSSLAGRSKSKNKNNRV